VTLVTDDDLERRTGVAAKIGAVTDQARELPLGTGRHQPVAKTAPRAASLGETAT